MALLVDLMNPKLNTVPSFTMQTSVQYPFHKSDIWYAEYLYMYVCINMSFSSHRKAGHTTHQREWMNEDTNTHAWSQTEWIAHVHRFHSHSSLVWDWTEIGHISKRRKPNTAGFCSSLHRSVPVCVCAAILSMFDLVLASCSIRFVCSSLSQVNKHGVCAKANFHNNSFHARDW